MGRDGRLVVLKSRFRSEEGGAGTFFIVLIVFLLFAGGAFYFFTQDPQGKKIAADLIKRYAQYTGTTTENPPGTIAPAPGVPEAPAPPSPEDIRRQTQADVYVKEAGDALTKGNIDVAGDMVEKALALVPNHSAALKLQVEVVRKKGERRVEEERQKRLASETAPKPVPVVPAPPVVEKPSANDLLIRAKAFLAAEDLVKAEEYARKAVDADPANAEAVQVLKSVLAAKKPVPAAPVNDNAANAEKAAALVKQSRSLLVQGHYDAAREVAVRALSITPEDTSITALITEIEEARKAAEPPKSAPVVAVAPTPQPVVAPVVAPPTPQPAPVVVTPTPQPATVVTQPATQPVPVQPAVQDSAEKARALLASAHILADTGSVEAARATALRALELDPSNRDIIAFLGTLEAKPKPVETAVVSGTAKSTAPDTVTPVFVKTPATQPVQPQPVTPVPEKAPVVQQPPVAPVVQPVTPTPPAVQPTPVAVPPVAQPTVTPVQPVQPAPTPTPPAVATALPMTKDNARQILAKLDDALRKGDVDAYTAMLGTDLAGPEKANVKEFLKEAVDIRINRDPAISLVPAENSATLVSDYTIEYRIQNVPVKVALQCKYGLVRTPEGGWIIDWVSSQRK
jgi:tetratricopeptide (TPR) repeat protein